jgi:hypothetical protein
MAHEAHHVTGLTFSHPMYDMERGYTEKVQTTRACASASEFADRLKYSAKVTIALTCIPPSTF